MRRTLVLFAREPGRQARDKGFSGPEAAELFAAFALGWRDAARRVGATLIVAAPSEDLAGWRRRFGPDPGVTWLAQHGASFGERLSDASRRAAAPGTRVVVVGGDVPPWAAGISQAFEALEAGEEAAVAPSPDGGVSVLALSARDFDLLPAIAPRRRDVASRLLEELARRRRRVRLLSPARDLDGRRDLSVLARESPPSSWRMLARLAGRRPAPAVSGRPAPAKAPDIPALSRLRAPPAA
jgi:glycosyltransferase A (GT-A) superfamily protein (DUF2064 family)